MDEKFKALRNAIDLLNAAGVRYVLINELTPAETNGDDYDTTAITSASCSTDRKLLINLLAGISTSLFSDFKKSKKVMMSMLQILNKELITQ